MNFKILRNNLNEKLQIELPEAKSHIKFAPVKSIFKNYNTIPSGAIKSSVLILLYPENDKIFFPVIERVKDGRIHSGQISLPGGHYENYDKTVINNALREANEEIGIIKSDVEIIGKLSPLYIPVSNFVVFPVLGAVNYVPKFIPDKNEVEKIFSININELKNPYITNEIVNVRNTKIKVPFYNFKNVKIWGATAMILSEFADILYP